MAFELPGETSAHLHACIALIEVLHQPVDKGVCTICKYLTEKRLNKGKIKLMANKKAHKVTTTKSKITFIFLFIKLMKVSTLLLLSAISPS